MMWILDLTKMYFFPTLPIRWAWQQYRTAANSNLTLKINSLIVTVGMDCNAIGWNTYASDFQFVLIWSN